MQHQDRTKRIPFRGQPTPREVARKIKLHQPKFMIYDVKMRQHPRNIRVQKVRYTLKQPN